MRVFVQWNFWQFWPVWEHPYGARRINLGPLVIEWRVGV